MDSNATWMEIIIKALTHKGYPMSAKEIYNEINNSLDISMFDEKAISSISATLSREINNKKNNSDIVRLSLGKFGLREWLDKEHFKEYLPPKNIKNPIDEVIAVIPKKELTNLIKEPGINFSGIPEKLILKKYISKIRHKAEEEFNVIQLVSVFIVHDGTHIITHKRAKRSPESRLHDEYSVMFGGHILSEDLASLFNPFDVETQIGFISRELEEEVILKSKYDITPIGFIYDDSREVSSQHLGLIFTVKTDTFNHEIGEKGFLIDPRVELIEDVKNRISVFENWSVTLIQNFDKIIDREREVRNA